MNAELFWIYAILYAQCWRYAQWRTETQFRRLVTHVCQSLCTNSGRYAEFCSCVQTVLTIGHLQLQTGVLQNRTTSFQRSFVPSTIRLWNNLPENIRILTQHNQFKRAVFKQMGPSRPPKYYELGTKIGNILHTKLRLGISNLNSHLFQIQKATPQHADVDTLKKTFNISFSNAQTTEKNDSRSIKTFRKSLILVSKIYLNQTNWTFFYTALASRRTVAAGWASASKNFWSSQNGSDDCSRTNNWVAGRVVLGRWWAGRTKLKSGGARPGALAGG